MDGFQCPICSSVVCTLPIDCPVCSLVLVSSASLARSYHHLFPVSAFEVEERISAKEAKNGCLVCQDSVAAKCTKCKSIFCADCDTYIHEQLHVCPGCSTITT